MIIQELFSKIYVLVANPISVEHTNLRAANSRGTSYGALPSYNIDFTTRQTPQTKRKLESQLIQQMSPTLRQFGSDKCVWILVVDLSSNVLRALAVAFDIRNSVAENKEEVTAVMER